MESSSNGKEREKRGNVTNLRADTETDRNPEKEKEKEKDHTRKETKMRRRSPTLN